MDDLDVPEPPRWPASQSASGSGASAEPPGSPPAPPQLAGLSPSVAASSQATEETGGLKLEDWLAFLRNRLILGGLATFVVLLLIAIVLLLVGSGDGGPGPSLVAGTGTPGGEATVLPRGGLIGRLRITVTMRNGPDSTFSILGTIPRRSLVSVVGRNADETWLQVTYPPGSQLRGWVNASFIEVTGDISRLAVAGPGAQPAVPIPTSAVPITTVPFVPSPTQPAATPTPTSPPPPTATSPVAPTRTPHPTLPLPPTRTPPPLPTETPTE